VSQISITERMPGAEDEQVIKLAATERRLLLTEDKDFGQLVFAAAKDNSGVILIRYLRLGVLLPCDVIVRDEGNGKVEVAGVDPVATMERTGNEALRATAEQVLQRLSAAIASVGR
jgi:Domain of unknown function (DUF5615)